MPKLVSRTVRIRRGWLDRLRGFDRLYETQLTDGQRVTFGRGATRKESEQTALGKWEAQFHHATEVTKYDLQVAAEGHDYHPARVLGLGLSTASLSASNRQRTECDDDELLLQAWEAASRTEPIAARLKRPTPTRML